MRLANLYLKYMTKLLDWIGSWYNEKWAWIFCIGSCGTVILWVLIK